MDKQNFILDQIVIDHSVTIRVAIEKINNNGLQFLVVVDMNGELVGSVSDGDIRRGFLSGLSLEDPISDVMNKSPISSNTDTNIADLRSQCQLHKIKFIPLVSDKNKLISVYQEQMVQDQTFLENAFFIMAGGKGKRLRPFTEDCPKPMLHVNGLPMLHHILNRAIEARFYRIYISINYLGDVIKDYFGDGSKFGVQITYIEETKPLGTGGALSIFSGDEGLPFVVTNGDVMSGVDYGALLTDHSASKSPATMVVKQHGIQNPFGTVSFADSKIISFEEKPIYLSHINAGIYALSPEVLKLVPKNRYFDMPGVFELLIKEGKEPSVYLLYEDWNDIGKPGDLAMVREKYSSDGKL